MNSEWSGQQIMDDALKEEAVNSLMFAPFCHQPHFYVGSQFTKYRFIALYPAGALLERVRRVHPHPLKFDNRCAVLRLVYLYQRQLTF